jgi:phenylacetic acid degradation protein
VAGIPAKVIRDLTEEEIAWKSTSTRLYQRLAVRCIEGMEAAEPLDCEEPNRGRVLALKTEQEPLNVIKQKK